MEPVTRSCQVCQRPIIVKFKSRVARTKYCSHACRDLGRDIRPTKHRSCRVCHQSYVPASNAQKWCKTCAPDGLATFRIKIYGLSEPAFQSLMLQQGGACAVCGTKLVREETHVDHDHHCCSTRPTCGKCVRGILCRRCNQGLGRVENLERVKAAQAYLRAYA